MDLRPIGESELQRVAEWLGKRENYQWLDFGNGVQTLNPISLKIMVQRDIHLLRVFTADLGDVPIGIVALTDINPGFRTGTLWYVLGDKRYGRQGYTTRAVSRILRHGFEQLGLGAVNAWTVAHNLSSVRVLERNGFRLIGRQRRCHYMDGQPCDRLLFDLLSDEYKELGYD